MDRDTEHYIRLAYNKSSSHDFSLNEVIDVFDYYFKVYTKVFLKIHPHLKLKQIERIIKEMPYIDGILAESNWYFDLIDQHFKTDYGRCDYNINHFFSGRIRELRFYEVFY